MFFVVRWKAALFQKKSWSLFDHFWIELGFSGIHSKRMKPYIGLYRGFYFCYVEGHLYRGLKYPQIWVYVEGRHIEGFLPYIKGLFWHIEGFFSIDSITMLVCRGFWIYVCGFSMFHWTTVVVVLAQLSLDYISRIIWSQNIPNAFANIYLNFELTQLTNDNNYNISQTVHDITNLNLSINKNDSDLFEYLLEEEFWVLWSVYFGG